MTRILADMLLRYIEKNPKIGVFSSHSRAAKSPPQDFRKQRGKWNILVIFL
ncbi:hypothetical protein B4065_3212 [Caldibacillus thermoamylovorans]|jgi:hypothetical protein|nr:hypothetical protein B4065_3212 [Caldibacillus thermoamylovorans]